MIKEVKTSKGTDAITSDKWHVIHAHFTDSQRKLPFHRGIASEHDDRDECIKAANALRARLTAEAGKVPAAEQDEVFVRRPGFKSLKAAKSRKHQARPRG